MSLFERLETRKWMRRFLRRHTTFFLQQLGVYKAMIAYSSLLPPLGIDFLSLPKSDGDFALIPLFSSQSSNILVFCAYESKNYCPVEHDADSTSRMVLGQLGQSAFFLCYFAFHLKLRVALFQ